MYGYKHSRQFVIAPAWVSYTYYSLAICEKHTSDRLWGLGPPWHLLLYRSTVSTYTTAYYKCLPLWIMYDTWLIFILIYDSHILNTELACFIIEYVVHRSFSSNSVSSLTRVPETLVTMSLKLSWLVYISTSFWQGKVEVCTVHLRSVQIFSSLDSLPKYIIESLLIFLSNQITRKHSYSVLYSYPIFFVLPMSSCWDI